MNQNESNGMWRGSRVGIKALHEWVRRHKEKPDLCERCELSSPHDLANISQKYERDVNDFEWLCRKCHMLKDGRLEKLHTISKGRAPWNKGGKNSEEAKRKMKASWESRRKNTEWYKEWLLKTRRDFKSLTNNSL